MFSLINSKVMNNSSMKIISYLFLKLTDDKKRKIIYLTHYINQLQLDNNFNFFESNWPIDILNISDQEMNICYYLDIGNTMAIFYKNYKVFEEICNIVDTTNKIPLDNILARMKEYNKLVKENNKIIHVINFDRFLNSIILINLINNRFEKSTLFDIIAYELYDKLYEIDSTKDLIKLLKLDKLVESKDYKKYRIDYTKKEKNIEDYHSKNKNVFKTNINIKNKHTEDFINLYSELFSQKLSSHELHFNFDYSDAYKLLPLKRNNGVDDEIDILDEIYEVFYYFNFSQ